MPTIFASVSLTFLFFYAATLAAASFHALSPGAHMLWGLFVTILMVLLQCLVFGFFIGSGKSIKRVVAENGLNPDWISRTRDYKNKSYPALMLAILVTATAGIVGGGVATGSVPSGVHQALVWAALAANAWSFRVSHRVLTENVEAIHAINREILSSGRKEAPLPVPPKSPAAPLRRPPAHSRFYFLAAASWVPYLYMKLSLGSRTFPLWPFLLLSGMFLLFAFGSHWKNSRSRRR